MAQLCLLLAVLIFMGLTRGPRGECNSKLQSPSKSPVKTVIGKAGKTRPSRRVFFWVGIWNQAGAFIQGGGGRFCSECRHWRKSQQGNNVPIASSDIVRAPCTVASFLVTSSSRPLVFCCACCTCTNTGGVFADS